jgi:hypothetical protein
MLYEIPYLIYVHPHRSRVRERCGQYWLQQPGQKELCIFHGGVEKGGKGRQPYQVLTCYSRCKYCNAFHNRPPGPLKEHRRGRIVCPARLALVLFVHCLHEGCPEILPPALKGQCHEKSVSEKHIGGCLRP